MKKTFLLPVFAAVMVLFSCEKDDEWISMSAMENNAWNEINAFRADSGRTAVTVNYDTMLEQAKKYAKYLASGNEDPENNELTSRWDIIFQRLGGSNPVALVSHVVKGSADITASDIIEPLLEGSDTAEALLEDVSIGAIGISFDKDKNAYGVIFMMKVE